MYTNLDNMEMVKDYAGAAVTTGATAYLLTKVLSGGSADRNTYGGMSIASTVGIAAAFGSAASKVAHDYVLPHIPQDEKWKSVESAGLSAAASVGGSLGYVYLMDPSVARADTLPITLYSLGGDMLGTYIYDSFVKPFWMSASYSG